MGNVLYFRKNSQLRELRVTTSVAKHNVFVQLIESCSKLRAQGFRAQVQVAISNAAGFRALKGFTDQDWAVGRLRHRFSVRRGRLARFLYEIKELVGEGAVEVKIDGQPIQLRRRA